VLSLEDEFTDWPKFPVPATGYSGFAHAYPGANILVCTLASRRRVNRIPHRGIVETILSAKITHYGVAGMHTDSRHPQLNA